MRIVLAFACLPLLYYVAAIDTARRYLRERAQRRGREFTPPISVLKPVRGLDRHTFENFASFCRQDYPVSEILFAVADPGDPAAAVIRDLIDRFPEQSIRLVAGVSELGPNSKVNKLCRLAREARYDLLVVSDSDISAPPGYLRAVAAPFRDPQVGAVTCLYRGVPDGGVAGDLEAIGISTDFAAGVLVARRLEGLAFTLGATMAATRRCLEEIGGFEALLEFCADDFELGRRISARGRRIELADAVVSTECVPATAVELLKHQFRWAVTLRHSRPFGYVGRLVAGYGLPWTVAVLAVVRPVWIASAYATACLALRLALAWIVGWRVLGDDTVRRRWWLAPAHDAVMFVVSVAAFFSNRIDWRGRSYELHRGRLVPVPRSASDAERPAGYIRT